MIITGKKFLKTQKGFALIEILVAVSIFVVIMLISGSLYIMSQRAYKHSEDKMELVQNGRVAFDRISREIRQSVDIATPLASSSLMAESEILFQDGHDMEEINYVFYYLDNSDLRRARIVYYFEEEPNIYVKYNSTNEEGELPESTVLEDKIVGEFFKEINFWEEDDLIVISSSLERDDQVFKLNTSIHSRN